MIANRLISWATGVHLHDYGCSLKVFRAEVVKPLRLYGEMHRFLPAIASEMGVSIAERWSTIAREARPSKYGISRTVRVILDLLTVKFLLSYSTRPLQIFGLIGGCHGLSSARDRAWVAYQRLFGYQSSPTACAPVRHSADLHGRPAGDARTAGRAAGADLPRVAGQGLWTAVMMRWPRAAAPRPARCRWAADRFVRLRSRRRRRRGRRPRCRIRRRSPRAARRRLPFTCARPPDRRSRWDRPRLPASPPMRGATATCGFTIVVTAPPKLTATRFLSFGDSLRSVDLGAEYPVP